jgi:hypothetical protein
LRVRLVKARGFDVNEADNDGVTPAHVAASNGHSREVMDWEDARREAEASEAWRGDAVDQGMNLFSN